LVEASPASQFSLLCRGAAGGLWSRPPVCLQGDWVGWWCLVGDHTGCTDSRCPGTRRQLCTKPSQSPDRARACIRSQLPSIGASAATTAAARPAHSDHSPMPRAREKESGDAANSSASRPQDSDHDLSDAAQHCQQGPAGLSKSSSSRAASAL